MPDGVGTTHHVRIGNDYHLIQPGSYRKRPAPLFGARFATGDPDYNNLSFWQHWAQTCWVGGIDAEVWMDDAMYDTAVGVDTSQHEVMVLARDLSRGPTGGWDTGGTSLMREFIGFNGKLYCMEMGGANAGHLYRYNDATATWTDIHTFSQGVRSACGFSGKLFFGDAGANLTYMNPDETFVTNFAKPSGITDTPYAMRVYRDKMYVGFGRQIWRMKKNETWDGSTAFHDAVGVNYIEEMEVHLGFLYMASQNGHILRTDGNNTFDLWVMDSGVVSSLRSFDGKLFVAVNEALPGTAANQGVLYQFTGAAVTELKRFGKEGASCTLGKMRVAARRLFYGASNLLGMAEGFGIAQYDPVEDAHSIFASNRDGVTYNRGTSEGDKHQVDDVVWWQGWLMISVRGHGLFRTKFTFKDVTRAQATYDTTDNGASPGSENGGWLVSSDFDAGTPGLLKLWNSITVHCDLPSTATSITMEYSVDGGLTWAYVKTDAANSTKAGNGTTVRYAQTWKFNNLKATRFKWRINLRTTDTTKSPQVRGIIVKYLPLPEPNWMWEMSLVLSETQELLDGTVQENVAVTTKTQNLENAFRAQVPVHFKDIDSTEWTTGAGPGVLVYDLQKDVRFAGPGSDGPIESVIRVVLLEAVEAY